MASGDWLFQLPSVGAVSRQLTVLRQWFDSDPAAQAIPDAEAEEFNCAADLLVRIPYTELDAICRHLGEGGVRNSELDKRRKILALLRSWRNPARRKFLVEARRHASISSMGDVERYGSTFTLGRLAQAHREGAPIFWLTAVLRMLGREAQISVLLDGMGTRAWQEHHIFLFNGRAMMRRILDGVSVPWSSPASHAEPSGQDESTLVHRLQQKESALNSLSSDIRKGERTRSDWKQTARQAEKDLQFQLQRVRAEVASAAEDLQRRQEVQQREMNDLDARYGQRLRRLQERLAEERLEFARALAERASRSGAAPLMGWRVLVTGAGVDQDAYRLLVQSAGGRLVDDGADILIALGDLGDLAGGPPAFRVEGTGLGAFERTLRQQVIPWVLRYRMGWQ
ncbi:MAG TPA: hypothetical protein VGK74_26820 [Symbiobacteriaceae bacterium]|jgi:hypothetical protein